MYNYLIYISPHHPCSKRTKVRNPVSRSGTVLQLGKQLRTRENGMVFNPKKRNAWFNLKPPKIRIDTV